MLSNRDFEDNCDKLAPSGTNLLVHALLTKQNMICPLSCRSNEHNTQIFPPYYTLQSHFL